jgi:hypothetical protein
MERGHLARIDGAGFAKAGEMAGSNARPQAPAVHLAAEPKPLDERASCSRRKK